MRSTALKGKSFKTARQPSFLNCGFHSLNNGDDVRVIKRKIKFCPFCGREL